LLWRLPQVANYLLDAGADPNRFRDYDYSTLMWALRSMNPEDPNKTFRKIILRMIEKGARVNFQAPITGRTALHLAAGSGDMELVQLFLRRGADRNAKAKEGWDPGTPADYARLGGHVEIALALEGKDPAPYRRTLHYAAKTGNLNALRALLTGSPDVNEAEERSRLTPLHYAAANNHLEAVRLLLAARAEPSPVNYAGITPLREAIVKSRIEMARMLIDSGARANIAQSQGCGGGLTEFAWAVSYQQYDLAKYMVEKGALDVKASNVFSEMWGHYQPELEFARLLIAKGALPTQDRIARLKGMDQTTVRRQLIAIYEAALRNPNPANPNVRPSLPPDFLIRALPYSALDHAHDQQFRTRHHRMNAERVRMPSR
jgi:ankyrin repeat protein